MYLRKFFNYAGGMLTIGPIMMSGPSLFSPENYTDRFNDYLAGSALSFMVGATMLYGVRHFGQFSSGRYYMGAAAGIGIGLMEATTNYTGGQETMPESPHPIQYIDKRQERVEPAAPSFYIHAPRP